MALKCFKCGADVTFDDEHIGRNNKKIPLDPATKTPHDCPMREKKLTFSGSTEDTARVVEVDKDDHGNELYEAAPDLTTGQRPLVSTKRAMSPPFNTALLSESGLKEYVDHTAKGQSKVKIFQGHDHEQVEIDYAKFLYNNKDKIKTQGAHDHVTRSQDIEPLIYIIYLYYEEVK
jgi:hypothetical protein